jgi:hypothetical protein
MRRRARELRKESTWAEKRLWRILRSRRLAGYSFGGNILWEVTFSISIVWKLVLLWSAASWECCAATVPTRTGKTERILTSNPLPTDGEGTRRHPLLVDSDRRNQENGPTLVDTLEEIEPNEPA